MSHKSIRILLVHDATGSRQEIRKLLSSTNIAHLELDSVSIDLALRGFRRNYYSVCVIDSAVKGIWILKEARRVGFATPIIMLAPNTVSDVMSAMRHGAADCLVEENLTAGVLEESICVVVERARYHEYRSKCARRYWGLVENSSEIVYTHDLQGNSTFLSKAGEQLIGYNREEISGINFCEIISPECVDSVWGSTLRMLNDRKPSSYEALMVTKEGLRIPVGVTMHLVYKKGNPTEVQGIVRDLSSQNSMTPAQATTAHFSKVILNL